MARNNSHHSGAVLTLFVMVWVLARAFVVGIGPLPVAAFTGVLGGDGGVGGDAHSSSWSPMRRSTFGGRGVRRRLDRTGAVVSIGLNAAAASHHNIKGNGNGDDERETTVVILYHKPRNVITSHSNVDACPSSSSKSSPSSQSSLSPTGGRQTVYQDVMSMAGYVAGAGGGRHPLEHNDDHNHVTASSFEDATGIQSKLHAIGRLDADTSGLLLLTNDGGLVHHVTNPTAAASSVSSSPSSSATTTAEDVNATNNTTRAEHVIEKTYEALIMGHHPSTTASPALHQILHDGVDIGTKYGGFTLPARSLTVLSHPTSKSTLVSITLGEGKNRQVRRMFHAVGSGVMQLKRTKVGELTLEGLDVGQWRVLRAEEVWEGLGWKTRRIHHSHRPHAAAGGPTRGGGGTKKRHHHGGTSDSANGGGRRRRRRRTRRSSSRTKQG